MTTYFPQLPITSEHVPFRHCCGLGGGRHRRAHEARAFRPQAAAGFHCSCSAKLAPASFTQEKLVLEEAFEAEGNEHESARRSLQTADYPLAGKDLAINNDAQAINEPCYTHSGLCDGCKTTRIDSPTRPITTDRCRCHHRPGVLRRRWHLRRDDLFQLGLLRRWLSQPQQFQEKLCPVRQPTDH